MAEPLRKNRNKKIPDKKPDHKKQKLVFSMRETLLNSTVLSIILIIFTIFTVLVIAGSPPSIMITDPMNGAILNDKNVYVGLSVDDPDWDIDHCEYYLDGMGPNWISCWGQNIWVEDDGFHSIDACVYDSEWNSACDSIGFELDTGGGSDTTPPTVWIMSPSNGELDCDGQVDLMLDVYDEHLNHCEYSISGGGSGWIDCMGGSIEVPDGSQTISIVAYDESMNTGSDSVYINVDTQRPHLQITYPPSNYYFNTENAFLNFDASDGEYMLTDCRYSLNSGPEQSTSCGSLDLNLPDGSYHVDLVAYDQCGMNSEYDSISFVVDTINPAISVESPRDMSVVYSPVQISLNVIDGNIGINDCGCLNDCGTYNNINCNGGTMEFDPGKYNITFSATDYAGNSNTTYVSITVIRQESSKNNKAPSMYIFSSSKGVLSQNYIDVSAKASDEDENLESIEIIIKKDIQVINSKICYADECSVKFLELEDGEYTILAVASDKLGLKTYSTGILVELDTTKPVIEFTSDSPKNDEVLTKNQASISALASDKNLKEIILELFFGTELIKQKTCETETCTEKFNFDYEGKYSILATAYDKAGNYAEVYKEFYVDFPDEMNETKIDKNEQKENKNEQKEENKEQIKEENKPGNNENTGEQEQGTGIQGLQQPMEQIFSSTTQAFESSIFFISQNPIVVLIPSAGLIGIAFLYKDKLLQLFIK